MHGQQNVQKKLGIDLPCDVKGEETDDGMGHKLR